jgi:deoxyribodipyrimidine photo-lyase
MIERACDSVIEGYSEERNRPDRPGTSRLSPYLHFGEVGPRQLWHALRKNGEKFGWPTAKWRQSQFLAEVGWREFAHHLLYHFPQTPTKPLRAEWDKFHWPEVNSDHLRAWQRGLTGYPIVDAGLRELWTTGWMHNRVRMIVASFLTKDLIIPWQEGARWFWDTLVDADLASNTMGWQWTAGCGADAAPYFRVFNPTSQGEKFDPEGHYVRRWIPELAKLAGATIHDPANQHPTLLASARVTLGKTYPLPIVDHSLARQKALNLFDAFREGTRASK